MSGQVELPRSLYPCILYPYISSNRIFFIYVGTGHTKTRQTTKNKNWTKLIRYLNSLNHGSDNRAQIHERKRPRCLFLFKTLQGLHLELVFIWHSDDERLHKGSPSTYSKDKTAAHSPPLPAPFSKLASYAAQLMALWRNLAGPNWRFEPVAWNDPLMSFIRVVMIMTTPPSVNF